MAPKRGLGAGWEALFPKDGEDLPVGFSLADQAPGQGGSGKAAPAAKGDQAGAGLGAGGSSGGGELQLPLDKLRPNPDQPRKYFDEAELQELADSIRENGIIEPIIAVDAGDGSYVIVAGERRYRAAPLAGLTEVPVIIRDYTEAKRMEVALIENVQRADLNPIEEAAAYKNLMNLTGLSQDEVASRVGKNRSTVANALRLLKLPRDIQKSLEKGELSSGHARAVLSVSGAKNQTLLYKEILEGGLSVREAEKRAAAINNNEAEKDEKGAKTKPPLKREPELTAMEQKFIDTLGTKVVINGSLQKGSIQIDYYSMEDLDRLYGILGGKGE
ncbi:chromosome partitioning protein ParB [Spirochaetia bacterium]|nr:chromosome partitioning protein ParB [Spirochaetia bacterium]